MKFVIDAALPIKPPFVVRFATTMFDTEDNLAGEYEIAVDLEPFIEFKTEEGVTSINVNAVGVQQHITSMIAEMQLASKIAQGFIDLDWVAEEGDDTEVRNNDEPATGDTVKLSPVLPEGN